MVAGPVSHFAWEGPAGVTFPGIVPDGVAGRPRTWTRTGSAWTRGRCSPGPRGWPLTLINDADAAGLAEVGRGRAGHRGVVLMLTFGTGIGSALLIDGDLVPNTEFGHLEIRGKDAEKRASDHAREWETSLGANGPGGWMSTWSHMEMLLSPGLFILGGGISRKSDKFLPKLTGPERPGGVPAAMHNDAGIVGAPHGRRPPPDPAGPAARRALANRMPRPPQRLLHLTDPQLAEVEHARGEYGVRPRLRPRAGSRASYRHRRWR